MAKVIVINTPGPQGPAGINATSFPYSGSAVITGSLTINGSLTTNDGVNVQTITASIISASQVTASLFGTASYALDYRNYYGSFYDTGSASATSATTIYSMSLSTTTLSNGIYISGSGNPYNTFIKFTNPGIYNIQFSAQFSNNNSSQPEDVWIWLRKNDQSSLNNLPDSAGVISVPASKGGSNGQIVTGWNYVIDIAANDFIQLLWHAPSTNHIALETLSSGSNPVHPRSPSLIVTANRIA